LQGWRRLGTRHRAAVGLSEVSDALTVVVSEETGAVSIAEGGRLRQDLDRGELHQALRQFYARGLTSSERGGRHFWQSWQFPGPRQLLGDLLYLFIAFLLAVVATTAVRISNDPIVQARQEGVTLNVSGLPDDTTLTEALPRSVIVEYEAPSSELPSITASTFQAEVTLADVTTGVTRVPVQVTTTASNIRDMRAVPAELDVSVAAIVSKTVPVSVTVLDADTVSSAYEISGDPVVVPSEVVVTGPEPAVEQTTMAGADISVANATTTVRDLRPLAAYDENGEEVAGLTIEPAETDVTVVVRRRINARDVGVRAVTTGSPPDGYWLSGLTVDPSSVTIEGSPSTLADMGSFVDTVGIDLSEATGETAAEVPLDIPGDVQALDSAGNAITNVTVVAQVAARSGDLLTERAVEIVNDRGTMSIQLDPQNVELLLSGPLPTLNAIEQQPELVRVVVDALQLTPGRTTEVTPEVIAPADIRAQLVDTSVVVTTEAN
ncbi:MAG: CdaR family protein, partial [Candidatus Promineifilaceae bacterium]